MAVFNGTYILTLDNGRPSHGSRDCKERPLSALTHVNAVTEFFHKNFSAAGRPFFIKYGRIMAMLAVHALNGRGLHRHFATSPPQTPCDPLRKYPERTPASAYRPP